MHIATILMVDYFETVDCNNNGKFEASLSEYGDASITSITWDYSSLCNVFLDDSVQIQKSDSNHIFKGYKKISLMIDSNVNYIPNFSYVTFAHNSRKRKEFYYKLRRSRKKIRVNKLAYYEKNGITMYNTKDSSVFSFIWLPSIGTSPNFSLYTSNDSLLYYQSILAYSDESYTPVILDKKYIGNYKLKVGEHPRYTIDVKIVDCLEEK